MKIAVCVRVC